MKIREKDNDKKLVKDLSTNRHFVLLLKHSKLEEKCQTLEREM